MQLKLYNTLTRKKEIFKPIKKGRVGIYSCGPTVYWYQHTGNLRTYIFSDILKRTLIYNGYKVKQVMSITDVGHLTSDADTGEDKVEKAAKKEGKRAKEIADFYFKIFKDDLRKLNILLPDYWPKATENIKEQIEIIKKLEEKGYVQTVKSAKKLVEKERPEVWDILEEIISEHPVMLNRAPTLHRLGIQAFYPVLVEGKAIRLHPLVCAAFNADFDGDQMAVHVPLSFEAQLEAKLLMLATHNILLPSSGRPIAIPSQDIVLGCYYLTKPRSGTAGEDMNFSSINEATIAYDQEVITLHTWINVRINHKMIRTTPGRVIFNSILPDGLPFFNDVADKGQLEDLVLQSYWMLGQDATIDFLDRLKDTGFEYATISGVTVSVSDLVVPKDKEKLLNIAHKEIAKIQKRYERGVITNGERYNQVIDTWTRTTSEISTVMFENLAAQDQGFNPVFMMADSGARGSKEQIRQLAGMRGLMAKPQKKITGGVGEIIESPITANFREGLTVQEYFISTHGARKGLADTALKTADAGYLTRRLVDVAQDVIIREYDCNTILGLDVSAIKEGEEIIYSLRDRILGRVAL